MDRLGAAHKDEENPRRKVKFENTLFSPVKSPRKQYYSIHPEFVSENLSIQKLNLRERNSPSTNSDLSRRCKSAPPPRTRNPITWDNPDNIVVRRQQPQRVRPKSCCTPVGCTMSTSVDQIGAQKDTKPKKRTKFNTPFFSATNSPRKQYFTIHPEWSSERRGVPALTYEQRCATFPPRRCRSAPPPRTRNPITWENPDMPDWR